MMISGEVIEKAAALKQLFESGKPFKHLCVDGFLEETVIKELHNDFPAFDKNFARNEFGHIGPKCVINNISSISPAYERFYQYMMSAAFLDAITALTGIPDLQFDERMYGGGTHLNLDGAELDPHVDFNYDTETGYHRRLNLLIYLNHEWDIAWGGAIELLSSPYSDSDARIERKVFNCLYNRCVIFETSEVSWHGFKRIKMPQEKATSGRKLISIYLYTKTRPQNEIAPPHGTFYVPYSPLEIIDGVAELTNEERSTVERLIKKRDSLLRLGFEREKTYSGMYESAMNRVREYEARWVPQVVGAGMAVKGSTVGLSADEWVMEGFTVRIRRDTELDSIEILGWTPDTRQLNVKALLGSVAYSRSCGPGEFVFSLAVQNINIPHELTLQIDSELWEEPNSNDKRRLGFKLHSIRLKRATGHSQ